MTDLKLYHELMLLALKDKEGTILVNYTEISVSAAILSELILRNKIKVNSDTKKVECIDSSAIGDDILDEVLQKIAEKNRIKDMQYWVSKLMHMKELRHRVARELSNMGILKATHDKILFIFNRRIYPELNPQPEQEIIQRLDDAIHQSDKIIDERTSILIALADSLGLLDIIFGKKALIPFKNHIKKISSGQLAGNAARETIEACEVAIMVAVILPTIIATTSTH